MSIKKAIVIVAVLLLPVVVSAQQKFALVIGNGAYTGNGMTRLANPVNDANEMEAALKGLGFTVEKLTDASRNQMEAAIIRLKDRLSGSKNTYGFFFYAGHGIQSNGLNYLIPVGADIPAEDFLPDRAVPVQAMLDMLNKAGNELNMIVLDACRDNPFGWSRSGSSRGLALVSAPTGSIVMYATSANSTASDGTGRNGLFTTQLLNNLKTPGLSIREVFDKTGADVLKVSGGKQHPELSLRYFSAASAYLGTKPAAGVQPTPAPAVPPAPIGIPSNFVRINGGSFVMGSLASEPQRDSDEVQHQVTISAFYMGKYQVTQKEYQEVMGTNPSYFKGDNLPVENVSWYDAVEYCNRRSQREGLTPAYTIDKGRSDSNNNSEHDTVRWVVTRNPNANGYRLPTEAEWEYACRAGTTTPFNTGNNITTGNANYDGNYPYNNSSKGTYREKTTDVGSFAPNPWGLYEMHGNVWEWCWDWYGSYSSGAQSDPVGASSGSSRVLRGGGWNNSAEYVRSASRNIVTPSRRGIDLGFRLVRP